MALHQRSGGLLLPFPLGGTLREGLGQTAGQRGSEDLLSALLRPLWE